MRRKEKEPMLIATGALLVLLGNLAWATVERVSCGGQAQGAECWMEVANRPGCYIWNGHLMRNQTVTWTGECAGSLAQGVGTLKWVWAKGKKTSEETGQLRTGRQHGRWVVRLADGTVAQGPFVEGKRHGRWIVQDANGNRREIAFKKGKRSSR